MFPWAGQPDIVRARIKDRYHVRQLTDTFEDIAGSLLGSASSFFVPEVEALAKACYFGLTTLGDKQTLGEEYCELLPTTLSQRPLTTKQRLLLFMLQVVVPYSLKAIQERGRRIAASYGARGILARAWNMIILLSRKAEHALQHTDHIHLAFFYYYGTYLSIPHRLARARYIYMGQPDAERPHYRVLSYLLASQIVATWVLFMSSVVNKVVDPKKLQSAIQDSVQEAVEADDASIVSCSLCLSPCVHITATDCGHLYCWRCICSWAREKEQCPLCRQPIQAKNFVCLNHL